MTTAMWGAASASVRGSMHVRRDLPNQDAVRTVAVDGGVIAAVADGHGGDRYVRSQVGAAVAVDVACRVATSWWNGARRMPLSRLEASIRSDLAPALVDGWRREVLAHAAANPFTDVERARAGDDPDQDPALSYGATALIAVAADDMVVIAQLGDGDVTVVTVSGEVLSPIAGDDRLVAGQTTSLCLPTAVGDVRAAVVTAEEAPALVVLSTDGYGNSFADPGWQTTVASDLRRQLRAGDVATVERQLPGWLADSAEVGGDDVTVAILVRDELERPVARPEPPSRSSAVPKAASVAGGLGLLVGALAGYVARGDGGDGAAAVRPTTTSSVSTVPVTEVPVAEEVNVGGEGGSLVGFVPDPADPQPRLLVAAAPDSQWAWTTQLDIGDATFVIASGVLRRDGDRVVLGDDFEAGSMHYALGYLWVIDAGSARLVPLDPTTGEPAGAVFPIEAPA